jgi:hypothetical protein
MSELRARIKTCFDNTGIPTTSDFLRSGLCHLIKDKDLESSIGERIEVSIEVPAGDAVVYFFSPLFRLTGSSLDAVMKKALLLNGNPAEMGGASIGIHAELNVLGLFYALHVDINFSTHRFVDYLDNFLTRSATIAGQLRSAARVVETTSNYYSSGIERRIRWS